MGSLKKNFSVVIFLISSLFLLLHSIILFFGNIYTTSFSSDSWAYFELSKKIFTDFYRVNYVRQFEYPIDYGISFPPLYPLLIALANRTMNVGVYAGYFINFIVLIFTFLILIKLSYKITSYIIPSIFFILLFITNTEYLYELLSARSIPLSIFLFSVLFLLLVKKRISNKDTVYIAFISGLMFLNRFDFFIAGIILGIILSLFKRFHDFKQLIIYYLVFLVTIFPWTVYCLLHFHRFYVADNMRTVFYAFNNFTLDYFPDKHNLPNMINNPLTWIGYRVFFRGLTAFFTFIQVIYFNSFTQSLIWLNVFLLSISMVLKDKMKKMEFEKNKIFLFKNTLAIFPLIFIQLFTVSLTGFMEGRYALIALYYVCILLTLVLFLQLERLTDKKSIKMLISIFVFLYLCNSLFPNFSEANVVKFYKQKHTFNTDYLLPNQYYSKIAEIIRSDPQDKKILIHGKGKDAINASQFSVLTGVNTFEPPGNVNDYTLVAFIDAYNIRYINTSCRYWLKTLNKNYKIQSTGAENLYRIIGSKKRENTQKNIRPDPHYRNCTDTL